MKKITSVVAAVLGGILSAHAQLNVVTTTTDLAAIAREIGGEHIEVRSLGRALENPHFVEPKPSYVVVLNRADVLIETGLDLEAGWLPALVDQTRNRNIRHGGPGRIVASAGVALLDVPTGPVTRAQGDVHPGGNPHFLLDPERAKVVARNIAEGFARVDAGNAETYRANLARFVKRVDERLAELQKLCEVCRGAKVVTYHKDFSYFAERFGLNVINTVEPKPGIAPSPAHIAALSEQMKAEGAQAILMQSWYDRRVPEMVAKRTGARLLVVPTQAGGPPGTEAYLDLMEHIVRQVAAALRDAR